MDKNIPNGDLNKGTTHILLGEIITFLVVVISAILLYANRGDWGVAVFFSIPTYFFIFLFLIYVLRGLSSSFRKIKLYKNSNLPIPKNLKLLKISSIIFILIPFIIVFLVFLKFY